jgi:hypothetical protein
MPTRPPSKGRDEAYWRDFLERIPMTLKGKSEITDVVTLRVAPVATAAPAGE